MPVACAFLGAIFTNIKTLQYANVETFIVFRASTPIIVSVCDYLFLGRELPSARSWLSLLGLVIGAFVYVITDSSFHVTGYYWVCVWYCVFCFDQVSGSFTSLNLSLIYHLGLHQACSRHSEDG